MRIYVLYCPVFIQENIIMATPEGKLINDIMLRMEHDKVELLKLDVTGRVGKLRLQPTVKILLMGIEYNIELCKAMIRILNQ
jgi:hypothetical protein